MEAPKTVSMRVQTRSPQSSHTKIITRPVFVYVRVPTFQVFGGGGVGHCGAEEVARGMSGFEGGIEGWDIRLLSQSTSAGAIIFSGGTPSGRRRGLLRLWLLHPAGWFRRSWCRGL